MDFDPAQYMKILAAVLLIPGLLFLFVVVFYVAFIGRASPNKAATRATGRTCLTCGQALLPDQNECPTCMPQLIQPVGSAAFSNAPPTEDRDGEPEVKADPAEAESALYDPPVPPIDSGAAYEGEIVDDPESPPHNS